MKETQIQNALRIGMTMEYILTNTFIYAWESDFFGITKSGYTAEIEIKTSRADFLADKNKKVKHNMLLQASKGNHQFIKKGKVKINYNVGRVFKPTEEFWVYGGENITQTEFSDIVAVNPDKIKTAFTSIDYMKINTPNKFYYAVPQDLIKKDEVPDYAGLIYIKEDGTKITIKNAPFLHKRQPDMTKLLLHKFYHLSEKLRCDNRLLIREKEYQLERLNFSGGGYQDYDTSLQFDF